MVGEVAPVIPDSQALPPMNLRQVQYFVTVADELNFTRAAERLHISTPALSQQIKALERMVGAQLLDRDTRRVRLTAAGQTFVRVGQQLLWQSELALAETRKAAGFVKGRLMLAALHDAEPAFEPFLTAFHASFPDIQVNMSSVRQAELIAAVRSRTVDAAMTWSPLLERSPGAETLHEIVVAPTEVLAALEPGSPLAARRTLPRGVPLRNTPAVIFERAYSPVTFEYVIEQLYGVGCVDPPVREIGVIVRAQEAMVRQVGAGAFAPVSKPVADLLSGKLAIRSFDPVWVIDGCVVWQPHNFSSALHTFITAAQGFRPGIEPKSATRARGACDLRLEPQSQGH